MLVCAIPEGLFIKIFGMMLNECLNGLGRVM